MSKWFKQLQDRQEGITLIELIVVVAIIGVLAWLITPRVLATLDNAKKTSGESAATEILAAMERFGAQTNNYPEVPAAPAPAIDVLGSLDIQLSDPAKVMDTTSFQFLRPDATSFCVSFAANDRVGTVFKVTETGVTNGAACS